MNKQELIAHFRSYSATYEIEASTVGAEGDSNLAIFYLGKSEAFAAAAMWLEEESGV